MAIDFTLTEEQKNIQRTAREFAQEVLKPVVAGADRELDTQTAFQMMKPAYEQAYELGYDEDSHQRSIQKGARTDMTQPRTPNPGTIERHRVERRADAAWTGSLFEGQGSVSVDSQAFTRLPITWASRTGHADGVTSPEELLAAAHASCFSMALSLVLTEAGTPPEQLTVSATCALEQRHRWVPNRQRRS